MNIRPAKSPSWSPLRTKPVNRVKKQSSRPARSRTHSDRGVVEVTLPQEVVHGVEEHEDCRQLA